MIHPSKFITKTDEIIIHAHSDPHNAGFDELKNALIQTDDIPYSLGLGIGDYVLADNAGDAAYSLYKDQFNGLSHAYSDFYRLGGNHDETDKSDPEGEDFYAKKWLYPVDGLNNLHDNKPYPVTGTYDAYAVWAGNMVIIMISDRNGGDQPGGEDGLGTGNANFRAGGNMTSEQFDFMDSTVTNNKDKIIILCTHQAFKDTTIGSGYNEFREAFEHSDNPDNGARVDVENWGYMSYLNGVEGEVNYITGESDSTIILEDWITENGKHIDICLNGHYHSKINDEWKGKTRVCQKHDTVHLNVASSQSKLHGAYLNILEVQTSLFYITGDEMTIRTWVSKDPNSVIPIGFYSPYDLKIKLKTRYVE